jgi:hypothetical protein
VAFDETLRGALKGTGLTVRIQLRQTGSVSCEAFAQIVSTGDVTEDLWGETSHVTSEDPVAALRATAELVSGLLSYELRASEPR